MADKVKSISASEFAGEVRNAVQKIALKGLPAQPSIVTRPPWIMGLIYRPPGGTLEDAQNAADKLAATLPSAKGATPTVVIQGGHVIIGFVQEPIALQE